MESQSEWIATQIAANGGRLWLLTPQTSTTGHVPLKAFVENRGKAKLRCGDTGYFLECVATLSTKNGKAVPYTSVGRVAFTEQLARGQFAYIVLTPGKMRSWEFNLADAFEPLEDGEYLLSLDAKLQFEGPGTEEYGPVVSVSARNIKITISSKVP